MVLATASSAINPLIYATRIRRFKNEIKKLLGFTIRHSDKYDTYEIRQSFKVRRGSVVANCLPYEFPANSDSGVGVSNDAYDSVSEEETPDPKELQLYEYFRKNRALSRISESPESICDFSMSPNGPGGIHGPMAIDGRFDPGRRPSTQVKGTIPFTLAEEADKESPSSTLGRAMTRSPHLTPPVLDRSALVVSPISHASHSGTSLAPDNISTHSMGRVSYHNSLNRQQQSDTKRVSLGSNILISEPITVDCDKDSKYFRLVVKRRVRHLSESDDSDTETFECNMNGAIMSRPKKMEKKKSIIRKKKKLEPFRPKDPVETDPENWFTHQKEALAAAKQEQTTKAEVS